MEQDDLAGVDQAGAETDDQAGLPAVGLAGFQQGLDRERDRGGGGVALVGDVTADDHLFRELQRFEHGVGDPHVGLVRYEDIEIVRADAGRVEGLRRGLGHRVGGPLEDRVALHPQRGPERHPVAVLRCAQGAIPGRGLLDQQRLVTVGTPDDRTDTGDVARPDDGRTRTVGEEERRRSVVLVRQVAQPLDTDDQHVLRCAATDEGVRHRGGIAETGAGGRDVERGGALGAELARDGRGHCRGLVEVGHGGDDDRVDLGRPRCRPAPTPSGWQRPTSSVRSRPGWPSVAR